VFAEVVARGRQYDWGVEEVFFAMYCLMANIGLLLANNFVLAILGDAYSSEVRVCHAADQSAESDGVEDPRSGSGVHVEPWVVLLRWKESSCEAHLDSADTFTLLASTAGCGGQESFVFVRFGSRLPCELTALLSVRNLE
jgi:hypothetical protein